MTTTAGADPDVLRARMAAAIGGRMAGHIERLGWTLLGADDSGSGPVGQLYVDCISLAIIARLLGSTHREPAESRKAAPLPRWASIAPRYARNWRCAA